MESKTFLSAIKESNSAAIPDAEWGGSLGIP